MYPGVGSSWREGVDGFIVDLHGDRGASNTDKDSKTTTQRRHTVPEWAESLKNSSLSESGFVLKSTLLGSRISRSHQNLMRAFRENHKKWILSILYIFFENTNFDPPFFKIMRLIELLI